ncbi:MAG: glycosyltransferase [Bacteroidetes bacterium]|nr:glycosyltransferase [Bacteroidota bacterium]
MKIAIIGTAFPLRGGIAHYNAQLYKYLSISHEVDIITFKRQYPKLFFPGKSQTETGEVLFQHKSESLIDSINPFNWIIVGLKLRKRNYDIIIFKYWLPFFGPAFGTITSIAKKGKEKVIAICDNIIPHEKRFGDKIFTRFAFRKVDSCIVQSDEVEKDLENIFPKMIYKKIPHPVYEIFGEPISNTEAKLKLKIPHKNIFLFFGYIRPYKGLMVLIEAMEIVLKKIDSHLLVLGEFYENPKPYFDKISELNLEKNITIKAEYIPNSNVGDYFSAADFIVLPYLDATQSGIAQISYYFNKPIIASNVGGLGEVVKNEFSGLLVSPNNPDELAEKIIYFYENNLSQKLTEGVLVEKKKYSWSKMVEAIDELAKN